MNGRSRIRYPLLTIFYVLLTVLLSSWAQELQTEDQIEEAIRICRETLLSDPHFPRIQYSLAQLLDSQVNDDQPDHGVVTEVIELYHMVGQPPQETPENRLPPIEVRFAALARAATMADEILQDRPMAIALFIEALHLDGADIESTAVAFETVMRMILSSVLDVSRDDTLSSILADGSIQAEESSQPKELERALYLCDYVGAKCPDEPVVDEYRGVTLRKMNEPQLALQSYKHALAKTKEAYQQCSDDLQDCAPYLGEYIRLSILVSAAAREAGVGAKEQMEYLIHAEKHIAPFTEEQFLRNLDDTTLQWRQEQVVDLYNNMGIVEKKAGSFAAAKKHFLKALEIKPNDGHTLVQLASLEDGTGEDAVANVKELDTNYVEDLFDGYSTRFESELVDVLEYKGHTLVYQALETMWNFRYDKDATIKTIIDLGCGTGLLGEVIANGLTNTEIHGVDLSERMVEIARARTNDKGDRVYQSVHKTDAADYLSKLENDSVNAIVAADVFIYIGDIGHVLEESSRVLVKGGYVGFTVESFEPDKSWGTNSKSKKATSSWGNTMHKDDDGVKLLQSGRFGHSRSYIDKVAKEHGFEVLSWEHCVLRKGGGKDVIGAVVILGKCKKMFWGMLEC